MGFVHDQLDIEQEDRTWLEGHAESDIQMKLRKVSDALGMWMAAPRPGMKRTRPFDPSLSCSNGVPSSFLLFIPDRVHSHETRHFASSPFFIMYTEATPTFIWSYKYPDRLRVLHYSYVLVLFLLLLLQAFQDDLNAPSSRIWDVFQCIANISTSSSLGFQVLRGLCGVLSGLDSGCKRTLLDGFNESSQRIDQSARRWSGPSVRVEFGESGCKGGRPNFGTCHSRAVTSGGLEALSESREENSVQSEMKSML